MDTEIITYSGLGILALGTLAWRFKSRSNTYGSAAWLPIWDASAEGMFKKRGLLLGDWTGNLPVFAGHDGHALTVAPTGRGKGTCSIIPNLLRQRYAFVVDPGGENTAIAIKCWRAKGYDVQVLNPWKMHETTPWRLPSHRFNPVAILDARNPGFASDATLIADMLVTRGLNDGGNSTYFKDEAQSAIRAMLMHMVTTEAREDCHLVTLRKWIMSDADQWQKLMGAMCRNKAAGGVIAGEATQLVRRNEQAPEEFSAIVSTMKQDTNFLDEAEMREALTGNDVNFAALKGLNGGAHSAGAIVSVVIPLEHLRTHGAYARLAIAVALWQMQRAPVAGERVLFVLDEFPALGRMDRIAKGLAELRKYKVWLWPVIQDLSQLKSLYDKSWPTFLSNASVKQWFGTSDLETAEYISKCCGESTVFHNGATHAPLRRALITPEEVQRLPANTQIVMAGHLKPARIRLTPYWERPEFSGLFHPNPYAGQAPGLPLATAPRWVWGSIARLAAMILEPAPVLIYAAAIAALFAISPAALERQHLDPKHHRVMLCDYRGVKGLEQREIRLRRFQPQCPKLKIRETYWL